jgi:hypothetical protein
MKSPFYRFSRILFVLSAILFIVSWILINYTSLPMISKMLPWMVIMYLVISELLFYILSNSIQKRFSLFLNHFMLATGLKLLLLIVILLVYVFNNKPDAYAFILNYFVLYIIYTAIEVGFLLTFNKNIDKNAKLN